MRLVYVKKGFVYPSEWEDILVDEILMTRIGDQYYPGDRVISDKWPFFGPGNNGVNNVTSPKYSNLISLVDVPVDQKPSILCLLGSDDLLISDNAIIDPGYLGKLGAIPGWPGESVYPQQPLLSQIRYLLQKYKEKGGKAEEVMLSCGHSPHIELPEKVYDLVINHITQSHGKL